MNIQLKAVTIGEVFSGYNNNKEEGVTGHDGQLDIRPAYQREFVYKDKQQASVIDTIRKGFPLSAMYWVQKEDGKYEVLDGQQRTLSFCSYINGDFSIGHRKFSNLTREEQQQILDYKLMVYICEGPEREKLEWFKTINIAGEKLTQQELHNAVYSGTFLTDAKKYFSKPNCQAHTIAADYLKGSPIRQDYLETALRWISKDNIEAYMADHQHDPNAKGLWLYFQSVVSWARETFRTYRKEMKGVDFGFLYDNYRDASVDAAALEAEIARLMEDEDVTAKAGIYPYVFTRNPKHLSIRSFTPSQRREAYERQKGKCPHCGETFAFDEMEADHITPWTEGGRTRPENCQMLCKACNRKKGSV